MKRLSGWHALLERGAVNKRLKRRTRLPPRLRHVIELVGFEVAAADPRFDLAGGWIDGDEARLQPGLFGAQLCHEFFIALELRQGIARRGAAIDRAAVSGGLSNKTSIKPGLVFQK